MKPVPIRYRRCRKKDLLPAVRLILKSMNHLREKTGKAPFRRRATRVPTLFTHLLATDPKLFYCAWRGETIVGFAGALQRGKQWYLAWLFVHPRFQDRGIGRGLIEKVWVDRPGMVHSLATMSYNQQAVGLYSSFGMVPESLMTLMTAELDRLYAPTPHGFEVIERPTQRDLAWIRRFEGEVRGFPRAKEWAYWGSSELFQPLVMRHRGRPVGYGLVNKMGELGPAAGTTHRNLVATVGEMVRWCSEHREQMKADRIMLACPHQNDELYSYLLSMGFRNSEMLVFMSDRPYADHRRYLPASLALF